jgi:hypothetical protein
MNSTLLDKDHFPYLHDQDNLFFVLFVALVFIDIMLFLCIFSIVYHEIRKANDQRSRLLRVLEAPSAPSYQNVVSGIPLANA